MSLAILALALTTAHATPVSGSMVGMFSDDDYPKDALRDRKEGSVKVRLTIDRDGKVARCDVRQSLRVESLDRATCDVLTARGAFTPASDRMGRPTEDRLDQRVTWRLPAKGMTPFADMHAETIFPVDGKIVGTCTLKPAALAQNAPVDACARAQPPVDRIVEQLGDRFGDHYRVIRSIDFVIGEGLPPVPRATWIRRYATRLTIAADGRISDCALVKETITPDSDTDTCRRLGNMRFPPASKDAGTADLRRGAIVQTMEIQPAEAETR